MKVGTITMMLLVIATSGITASAAVISYTDNFGAWANANEAATPGYEFGPWLVADNSNMLSWDLTVTAGFAVQRWNSYTITAADAITAISFDWRFANDRYDRVALRLLDASNTVLWTATSTYGGWEHPWNTGEIISGLNTTSLRFEYRQVVDPIYGKSGLFASNSDDWDGAIDNVTLTTVPEPVTLALLGCGLLFARRTTKIS